MYVIMFGVKVSFWLQFDRTKYSEKQNNVEDRLFSMDLT